MNVKFDLTKLAAAVMAAGVLLTGCAKETPEQTTQAQTQPSEVVQTTQAEPVDVLEILEIREADGRMEVETSWCTVSYPYAFSDLMTVGCETLEGTERLVFGARLEQGECPLFYLSFGEESGILLGQLTLPETGDTVSVWAGLYQLDEGLADADRTTCLAVQECINDVIASLSENGNFVPEE